MYFLAKLFNFTFLSPGLFLILGGLGYYYLGQKKKTKLAKNYFLVALVLLYLLSIRPIKNLLIIPLEDRYLTNPARVNCQVIIVMGGGIKDRSREANLGPALSDSSLRRCLTAYQMWRRKPVPFILCGGNALKKGVPEALVMRNFLCSLGVPSRYILAETKSRNTYENIKFIKSILRARHWYRPAVVTSAAHLPRTVKIFKHFSLKVIPVPADFQADHSSFVWYDFLPLTEELMDSFNALHEYIGIVYYKLYYRI